MTTDKNAELTEDEIAQKMAEAAERANNPAVVTPVKVSMTASGTNTPGWKLGRPLPPDLDEDGDGYEDFEPQDAQDSVNESLQKFSAILLDSLKKGTKTDIPRLIDSMRRLGLWVEPK